MNWGILATGTIANKFATTVNAMAAEGERLAAVGSRRAESAKAFAAQYNMKLEKQVIDRRVNIMKAEGIDFVTCADVGGSTPAQDVLDAHDAVVLACGAKQARDINAPGRDAQGIYFAVDYLTSVTRSLLDSGFSDGKAVSAKDKKVLVIGGGDTGNDCVGTAIRQGCASVTQLEMMPCPPTERTAANAWPEWPKVLKTDYGQQEAIAVFGSDPRIYQTTVKEFYKDEAGQVCGALIAKLESKVVDEATGRRPGHQPALRPGQCPFRGQS